MDKASDSHTPATGKDERLTPSGKAMLLRLLEDEFSPFERLLLVTSVPLCSCPVCAILRGKGVGQ